LTIRLQCNRNGRPSGGICYRLTFRWGHVSHTHTCPTPTRPSVTFTSLTHKNNLHNTTVSHLAVCGPGCPCHYKVNFNPFHAKNETARPENYPFAPVPYRGGWRGGGFNAPPRNSEVLTKLSRIPSSV
jgi:hypothetical protein